MSNILKGTISEIERYAIKDGPGIRTVVFLKGCPLRCLWCANPETQITNQQLMYWQTRCIGCKQCINTCPYNALSWSEIGIKIDREICASCGSCVTTCNSNALTMAGKSLTVDEVVEEVMKDAAYYQFSGGGVTFSGGEATTQATFLIEACKMLKGKGITTCIETCGYAKWEIYEKLIPYMDYFFYDLKTVDSDVHQKLTGVSSQLILDNYIKLVQAGVDITVRIPIIPSLNDTDANITNTLEFLEKVNPGCHVSLLPYHSLGVSKYDKLDMEYRLNEIESPSRNIIQNIKQRFEKHGFYITIGE